MNMQTETTALDRIKRIARRISREERRSSALQMFDGLGLDEDDVAHMAESVGLEADDLLLMSTTSVVQAERQIVDGQTTAQVTEIHELLREVHREVCGNSVERLNLLSQTQHELYQATSKTPEKANELCIKAGHSLSGHTRECLSVLVKLGLLKHIHREGYVRT